MIPFLAELKRRKVVRVAVAYAVAAFVVLQLADLVLEPLGLPPWTMALVIVLVALGAIPALILAWAFEWTPEGVRREVPRGHDGTDANGEAGPSGDAGAGPSGARTPRRWPLTHRIVVAGAALVVALAGVAFATLRGGERAAAGALDPDAVAVLPFRVAADPSLAYLGQGMVDLLAAKLTGEGGPRAVDSRAVLRLWEGATQGGASPLDRPEALRLARAMGAGQLLLGEIVGTAGQITLSAQLHGVASGSAGAPVSVVGPIDSLPTLADRLVAQLLSVRAGEGGLRLEVLTSASLPALRAYFAGKEAYRGGRFLEAAGHFRRAVEIDSTFALAGLELMLAGVWAEGGPGIELGTRVAWQGRDRLPPRERRRLELNRTLSFPEALSGWEALARENPTDPLSWLILGETLFHDGPGVGHPGAMEGALHAFERAVALDSIYAPALFHAIEIHADRGDTAQVRRLAQVYFHRNAPESGHRSYIGWRTALALGDGHVLAELRASRFEGVDDIRVIPDVGQLRALPMDDVEMALAASERRAGTTVERAMAARDWMVYLLNAGRPAAADRRRTPDWQLMVDDPQVLAVRAAIYGDGDEEAAATAAGRLEARLAAPLPSDFQGAARRLDAACALEERRLARGDASRTAASVAAVRGAMGAPDPFAVRQGEAAPMDDGWREARLRHGGERCIAKLLAWQAAVQGGAGSPAVAPLLARLDSLLTLFDAGGSVGRVGNLVSARLHAERGDLQEALRALRRRSSWGGPYFLTTFLREEARLAARVGDVEGALRAYEHYLHLRYEPEPALRDEVERIRAEYERLHAARPVPR
jgi:tetratricopeptide (TPR) repeat protein